MDKNALDPNLEFSYSLPINTPSFSTGKKSLGTESSKEQLSVDYKLTNRSEIIPDIEEKITSNNLEFGSLYVKDKEENKFSQNPSPYYTHLPFPKTNNNISPFHGKENERIEDWLYIVELILEGHGVTQDKSKILFASSYLRDSALHEYQAFTKNSDRNSIREKIETVFDTGATISLISLSVAKKLNLHINPSHQKINTADGNTHEVLGETDLIKIEIEETVAHLNFVITNILHIEILLGLDCIEDDDLTNEIVELNYDDYPPLNDEVYIKNEKVQNKFEPSYTGPFFIDRITENGNYNLKNEKGERIEESYARWRLKFTKQEASTTNSYISDDKIEQKDEISEIEKILDHKKIGRGFRYLIKWKNFPHKKNEWKKSTDIQDKNHINEYHNNLQNRPKR
ncbi:hypothetical protein BpHYR1_002123 [Brachionus plicatilis]|uniref:Chromo domain-containing protein n=1 Tax=Brachionus plicatilis TaxID=10195 RepID=A0A3M7RXE5_BRAPC|nr:hypothetical protein BpHYR1_002123 [Brachionus plicatilis]